MFAETAGGVTSPACASRRPGRSSLGERTVAVISGHGLKTMDALSAHLAPTHTINAGLEDFQAALDLSA
jgi:threonine synthase